MSMIATTVKSTNKMQQARNAVRSFWSTKERAERQQIAKAKQQRLFNMFFVQKSATPVSVA